MRGSREKLYKEITYIVIDQFASPVSLRLSVCRTITMRWRCARQYTSFARAPAIPAINQH